MYFTQFPVNLTRRSTPTLLSNPYRLHAMVAGSFPSNTYAGGDGRLLWRVDRLSAGGAYLYIVSREVPSLVGINEQMGWPDLAPQWKTLRYDAFLAQIEEGQSYSFRLVANPVYRTSRLVDTRGQKKRIAHVTPLQQTAWLIGAQAYHKLDIDIPSAFFHDGPTRAEANGFAVCNDPATDTPMISVTESKTLHFRRGDTRMTLATARYDGVLRVTDANALRHALVAGIGKAKGFGCGLLTLARIPGVQ